MADLSVTFEFVGGEWAGRLAEAVSKGNDEQLARLKRLFDADTLFRLEQNGLSVKIIPSDDALTLMRELGVKEA